jgi:hypothetical protein
LDPGSYPEFFFFKFGLKLLELSELKFDSPLHHAVGCKIFRLHDTAESQISLLHDAAGVKSSIVAEIFPLRNAAGIKSPRCII